MLGMVLSEYANLRRGSAILLSRLLGVSPVVVSQWQNKHRQVPAARCPAIEKATGGLVTCEELRPDVDWGYLRGTAKQRSKRG